MVDDMLIVISVRVPGLTATGQALNTSLVCKNKEFMQGGALFTRVLSDMS